MIVDTEKIVMITVGQLKEFASSIVRETIDAIQAAPAPIAPKPTTEYRYGLRAISDMFDVCHVTAQRYKDTFLKPAIEQRGRKIRIDVALAQKLFKEHTNNNP